MLMQTNKYVPSAFRLKPIQISYHHVRRYSQHLRHDYWSTSWKSIACATAVVLARHSASDTSQLWFSMATASLYSGVTGFLKTSLQAGWVSIEQKWPTLVVTGICDKKRVTSVCLRGRGYFRSGNKRNTKKWQCKLEFSGRCFHFQNALINYSIIFS